MIHLHWILSSLVCLSFISMGSKTDRFPTIKDTDGTFVIILGWELWSVWRRRKRKLWNYWDSWTSSPTNNRQIGKSTRTQVWKDTFILLAMIGLLVKCQKSMSWLKTRNKTINIVKIMKWWNGHKDKSNCHK